MSLIISETAIAYVNHGRWVADCPRKFCGNAFALEPRQPLYQCMGQGGCGMVAMLTWPADAQEIWDALQKRPVPTTRNWYPHGHPVAEQCGLPTGQTAKELLDEQEVHERG